MPKKAASYKELMKMAQDYGVADNALFQAAADQYREQLKVLKKIYKGIAGSEDTVTKEYVKGRENVCVNPLIAQLPKHTDSANKTLQTMLDIIERLGHQAPPSDKLGDFLGQQ